MCDFQALRLPVLNFNLLLSLNLDPEPLMGTTLAVEHFIELPKEKDSEEERNREGEEDPRKDHPLSPTPPPSKVSC